MSPVGAKIVKGEQARPHWPSVVQLTLSALGIVLTWLIALGSFIVAAVDVISGNGDLPSNAGQILLAASLFFTGLILVPSAWLALLRLQGKAVELPAPIRKIGALFKKLSPLLFLPLLALGTVASQSQNIVWLLLPPVHVLVVSMIILWLIMLATRGLMRGSNQQIWGSFGSGLTLGPLLAFGAEVFVALFFLLFVTLYLTAQPSLLSELEEFVNQAALSTSDPSALLPALEPLLSDPILLIFVFGFVAMAVPLIEELVKPVAVYLLLRRKLSPSDGFVLGAVSGAGFALFEYLTVGATPESWLPILITRIGTTAMHMFTAGLMGWAIVSTKNEKRYGLLLGSYALSVTLHGLWNSMAILGSIASLSLLSGGTLLPAHFAFSSWLVLLVLAVGSILLLRKSNLRLLAINSELDNTPVEKSPKD